MKHILHTQSFDQAYIGTIFELTDKIQGLRENEDGLEYLSQRLRHRSLYSFFYQESTRTRLSFEDVGKMLGMRVNSTTNAAQLSSAAKGETLEHSIRIMCEYRANGIVLRHRDEGAANRAAAVVEKYDYRTSIINAGDGIGQHPTQALLDMYTIKTHLGRLENYTIIIGGDLEHSRTTHSLAYLVSRYPGVKIIFVSPPEIQMKEGILEHLREKNVEFISESSLLAVIGEADVIYWTRLQKEYHRDTSLAGVLHNGYIITTEMMRRAKKDALLLHPLPIVDEIEKEVEDDPRALYFKQAGYGIPVRMAILCDIFKVNVVA